MHKRQLGQGGPMVGAVGLGCMNFAGFYGPCDEATSHRTLATAIDLGVDFLDTANVYGNGLSEEIMGRFLKGRRGEVKIATKCGIRRDPVTQARGFDNSAEHIREALEASLQRLGTDHVDLYYIHRRDPRIEIEEVMTTLVRLKEEGKIGGIGFSEIAPSSLRRAHAVHPVMAVQSEYSIWTRLPELGMIQTCKELNVAFVPFSPVCRGMLGAVSPDPTHFPDSDFRKNNPRFMAPHFSANKTHFDHLRSYAADKNTTAVALGIAWILARGDHLIPIPGTRSAEHLRDCAAGAALTLTDSDMADLEKILPCGFAHGDRYSQAQNIGPERYC